MSSTKLPTNNNDCKLFIIRLIIFLKARTITVPTALVYDALAISFAYKIPMRA